MSSSRASPSPEPRCRTPLSGSYKVLCVTGLHSKASDDVVRDTLYREYKGHGDISVRVVHEQDERVAYVYFASFQEARDALHARNRIVVYDKPVSVEPVMESRASAEPYRRSSPAPSRPQRASRSPSPSYRESSRYRSRSRESRGNYRSSYQRRPSPDDYHERGYGYRGYSDRGYSDRGYGDRGDRSYSDRGYERGYGDRGYGDRGYDRGGYDRGGYGERGYSGRGGYSERDYDRGGYERSGYGDREGYGEPRGVYHERGYGGRGYDRGGGGYYNGPRDYGHRRDSGPPSFRGRGGYFDRRPPRYGDPKRDRFPNYLNHVPPEEDPLATRTLFVGNLELNITDKEIQSIFGRHGRLVDIDIKRPAPGTGNAYAFIRFENLDQACRAKTELSGQYIGKFQCKIGYGKVNATPKVWIGGLGSWASVALLEREFDRFGAIKKIDYVKGEPYAFIFYESLDAATAAVSEMRGFPLGGNDRRIRMDYADLDIEPTPPGVTPPPPTSGNRGGAEPEHKLRQWRQDDRGQPPRRRVYSEDERARSVGDLLREKSSVWEGLLMLKDSLFATKMCLVEGDRGLTRSLRENDDSAEVPQLKITQRLRLDDAKLEDVRRRLKAAASHAVFLGGAGDNAATVESEDKAKARPLRNLISYLKQKESAGVMTLGGGGGTSNQLLYCFPPCAFSFELLRRGAPLIADSDDDDHLVILVVSS